MVTWTEFISKWKAHLLFSGAFLAAVAFSVVVNLIAGNVSLKRLCMPSKKSGRWKSSCFWCSGMSVRSTGRRMNGVARLPV